MQGTLLRRGLTRRCPRCGEWNIFEGYFKIKDRCPRCGLDLVREQGYYVGAMTMAIIAAELVTLLIIIIAVIWTWPDMPVLEIVLVGVAANILVPILFYPVSKTLWLAVDLGWLNKIDREEMRD